MCRHLPVMLAAAIAVRVDSSDPVLLRQQRIGEGGRPFQMLKFRTMVAGAEAEEQDEDGGGDLGAK